jgi:chromosome segregation ATPase
MKALMDRRDSERQQLMQALSTAQEDAHTKSRLCAELEQTLHEMESLARENTDKPSLLHWGDECIRTDNDKITTLERENHRLRQQVNETSAQRVDALMEEFDTLLRVKNTFESKFLDAQTMLEFYEGRHATDKTAIAALETQRDALEAQVAAHASAVASWNTREAAWDEQKQTLDRERDEIQAHLSDVMDRYAREIATSKALEEDLSSMQALVDCHATTIASMETSLNVSRETQAQSDAALTHVRMEKKIVEATVAELTQKTHEQTRHVEKLTRAMHDTRIAFERERQTWCAIERKMEHHMQLKESEILILEHVHADSIDERHRLTLIVADQASELRHVREREHMVREDMDSRDMHWMACRAIAREDRVMILAQMQQHVATVKMLDEEREKTRAALDKSRAASNAHAMDAAQLRQQVEKSQAHIKSLGATSIALEQAQAACDAWKRKWEDVHVEMNAVRQSRETVLADVAALQEAMDRWKAKEKSGHQILIEIKAKQKRALEEKDHMVQVLEARLSREESKNRALERSQQHTPDAKASDLYTQQLQQHKYLDQMKTQLRLVKDELEMLHAEHKTVQEVRQPHEPSVLKRIRMYESPSRRRMTYYVVI